MPTEAHKPDIFTEEKIVSLEEILATSERPSAETRRLEMCKTDPTLIPKALNEDEIILLQLLVGNVLGTGSQRGSITRILNTLKSKITFPDEKLQSLIANSKR
jgi:hypothetical protein